MSGISSDALPRFSGQGGGWRVIIPGPHAVARGACEHEGSGDGHCLYRLRCPVNVPGVGPAMEAEA